MQNKLDLSLEKIDQAKSLARNIASPIQEFIDKHTTDTVERATLRVLGADGIDTNKVPVPNLAVSSIKEHLSCGATRYYVNAMLKKDISASELNDAIADGIDISTLEFVDFAHIEEKAEKLILKYSSRVRENVDYRNRKQDEYE